MAHDSFALFSRSESRPGTARHGRATECESGCATACRPAEEGVFRSPGGVGGVQVLPVEKLVVLAPYYWPERIGSAPYCADMAEWFAAAGRDVRVVTSRPHYPSPAAFPEWIDGSRDTERHNGVAIERVVSGRDGSGFVKRVLADVRFLVAAVRRLRGTIDPGTVIVAFVPSSLTVLAARLLRPRGCGIVAVVHDVESGLAGATRIVDRGPLIRMIRWVERFAFNSADRLIVLSEAMRDVVARIGAVRPISVQPIWIFTELQPLEEPRGEGSTVMYSGNFGKKQGLEAIGPLAEGLAKLRPAARVVLQGDGSEKVQIAEMVRRIGVENVEFRDIVPIEDLIDSLRQADVHLVLQAAGTTAYALPSKIFTIMSAGRAFVAVADEDSPVRRLVVESGGGLVVPPGDPEALLAAVASILDDRERCLAMGRAGYDYVRLNMARDTILGAYDRIVSDTVVGSAT